ncbi:MAG TPA: ATP-binding protein [Solirubrobacteraceae bacterium]|nr:ATP-binding protein [Solirubrobacteraceae bacterium]
MRLTLLYGACFIVAGAGLLGITYALYDHATAPTKTSWVQSTQLAIPSIPKGLKAIVTGGNAHRRITAVSGGAAAGLQRAKPSPAIIQRLRKTGQLQLDRLARRANFEIAAERAQSRSSLLAESGIALGVMALLSIGLGWLLAGRALSPLRTMNQRARAITEDTLHERLGVTGRQDELGELAATFDAVLARLERAFEAQRQFVANASHELRTPITLERALLEVALADPESSVESLRHTCRRVLAAGEQQEQVIDALLTLARSQAGITAARPVRLDELVAELLEEREPQLDGMRVMKRLEPVTVSGDPALLERLVTNLLHNATSHNCGPAPWVAIQTEIRDGTGEVSVANGGPPIPVERVDELFEPFRRLEGDRTGLTQGLGLGLSIVRAVALAHGGGVQAEALPAGGLRVVTRLGCADPGSEDRRVPSLHSVVDVSTDGVLAGPDRADR